MNIKRFTAKKQKYNNPKRKFNYKISLISKIYNKENDRQEIFDAFSAYLCYIFW